MKLKLSTSKNISIKKIQELRRSVGWRERSSKKWHEILAKSSFVVTIWDEDKLVGMGRIMEDGIMCMFYDILVREDYRKKGIGKMIMKKLVAKVKKKKYTSIALFASQDDYKFLSRFYGKFGFEKADNAMELKKYMK